MISRYKKCILDGSVRVVEGIIARKHITLEVQREYEQLTQLYELLARHEMSMEDDSLFTIFILSDGTVRVHADQMVTLKEQCDLVVSIPISATTESLNASVATSIALFHVDQQRREK